MSRLRGVGGRGMLPPCPYTAVGYAPQGEEKNNEQEKFLVGDVMGMMRPFQRIS
jgi:hypothetical protein